MMWRLKCETRHMERVLLAAAGETCSPLGFCTAACCKTVKCANSDGGKVATYSFLVCCTCGIGQCFCSVSSAVCFRTFQRPLNCKYFVGHRHCGISTTVMKADC